MLIIDTETIVDYKETTTAAADGEEIQIQVSGFNDAVTSAEAIDIGDAVGSSANGDVREWDTESATSQPFAVCVNAFAGTAADGAILIIDKGWLG